MDFTDRRRKLFELYVSGNVDEEKLRKFGAEYGLTVNGVYDEWKQRREWLPTLVGLEDIGTLMYEEVAAWRVFVADLQARAQRFDDEHSRTASVSCLKVAFDAKRFLSEFMQSLGLLPRAANVNVVERIEPSGVKMSESDAEVISRAAAILNKAGGSAEKPGSLH
jgi:hypothetical protein